VSTIGELLWHVCGTLCLGHEATTRYALGLLLPKPVSDADCNDLRLRDLDSGVRWRPPLARAMVTHLGTRPRFAQSRSGCRG
jgi:hypothetical protein